MTYRVRVLEITTTEAVRLDQTTSKATTTLHLAPDVDIRIGPTSAVSITGPNKGTLVAAGDRKTITTPAEDTIYAIAVDTDGEVEIDQVDSDG